MYYEKDKKQSEQCKNNTKHLERNQRTESATFGSAYRKQPLPALAHKTHLSNSLLHLASSSLNSKLSILSIESKSSADLAKLNLIL